MMYVDAHCHYIPDPDEKTLVLYNSVTPEDWDKIPVQDNIIPFFGIHPWHADPSVYDISVIEKIKGHRPDKAVWGIGETGLDKLCGSSRYEDQILFFRRHLDLAVSLGVPVSVHCVRGWNTMTEILDTLPKKHPVLMHCFSGSAETAARLLKRNTWFSFSPLLLREGSLSMRRAFASLPADRLLLESDSHVSVSLEPLYGYAALHLREEISQVFSLIRNNLYSFLNA